MRVISKRALAEFWAAHSDSAIALQSWYHIVTANDMRSFAEVKAIFRSADLVGDRLVFDVRGNTYRVVCGVDFRHGILDIKFVGTHADYDRIDVRTVELR